MFSGESSPVISLVFTAAFDKGCPAISSLRCTVVFMDSELLSQFIGYFPDYLSALSCTLLRFLWTTFVETALYDKKLYTNLDQPSHETVKTIKCKIRWLLSKACRFVRATQNGLETYAYFH